ncbi:hypothetical protein TYRP_020179 [Tyrophagus putrescentiae]|nr:hypothetical protein TYRP_020179 [Tyrophagus putrescentiae]
MDAVATLSRFAGQLVTVLLLGGGSFFRHRFYRAHLTDEPRSAAERSSGDILPLTKKRLAVASSLLAEVFHFYDDTCPETPLMPQWARDS